MNIETINSIVKYLSYKRPGIEYWISDGNHTYCELQRTNWILKCLISEKFSQDFLEDIENISYIPDDHMLNTLNKIIKYYKNKGMSTKKLYGYGNTFEYEYNIRTKYIKELINKHQDISWKTKRHYNEDKDPMFNGCFMIGMNTPTGPAMFHLKLEHWDDVNVKEIENGPKYDGATTKEILFRLYSVFNKEKLDKYKQSKVLKLNRKNM